MPQGLGAYYRQPTTMQHSTIERLRLNITAKVVSCENVKGELHSRQDAKLFHALAILCLGKPTTTS